MWLGKIVDQWHKQSLATQFLFAGGAVSLVAIILIGIFVTSLIEAAITRNSAATTALYVDSVIAPLLPDMQKPQLLDDTVSRALDETLQQGALGDRLLSFRLWRRDGLILYSNEKHVMGNKFVLNDNLRAAFSGNMVAEFNQVHDLASGSDRPGGKPLLQIYNPVLQPWSGTVVAVSEFYEKADEFQHSLVQARALSWLAVVVFISAFFLLLSAVVVRGSRTIDHQRVALRQRIRELSELLAQNEALHTRVQRASKRVAALNESHLRNIGADLHNGPAQLIALASLRLDSPVLTKPSVSKKLRENEISAIKQNLDDAMHDIREICNGLVLPKIEAAALPDILDRVIRTHRHRTGAPVQLELGQHCTQLSASAKICVYRFVQEALNNGYRHGGGMRQRVVQSYQNGKIFIAVTDEGPGFDPDRIHAAGIGLTSMRERVESIGGQFEIHTSKSGTRVAMTLCVNEKEQA